MRSNYRDAYWTLAQMVAHRTVKAELSSGGKQPITLSNGEMRTFLEDGDTVVLRRYCEGSGYRRIGCGECRGRALRAIAGRTNPFNWLLLIEQSGRRPR